MSDQTDTSKVDPSTQTKPTVDKSVDTTGDKSAGTTPTSVPPADKTVDTTTSEKPPVTKETPAPIPPPAEKPSSQPEPGAQQAAPAPAALKQPAAAPQPVVVAAQTPTQAPTPAAQPTPPVLLKEIGIVTELLGKYKEILSARSSNRVAFQGAAKIFGNVISRMLQNPTPEMFAAVWDFFETNKDGVMQMSVALQGIEVLDLKSRFQTEIVYTLFRQASNGLDVGDNKNMRSDILASRLKCVPLILFLQEKATIAANKKASAA